MSSKHVEQRTQGPVTIRAIGDTLMVRACTTCPLGHVTEARYVNCHRERQAGDAVTPKVPVFTLRLLPPKSYRLRHRPPEWDVEDERGRVVGHISKHHIGGASRPFFNLTGIHPITHEVIPLELSADMEERVVVLAQFLADPDRFAHRYPSMSKARIAFEQKRGTPPWMLGTGTPGRHG